MVIYSDSGIALIGMLYVVEMPDAYDPTYGWSLASGTSVELQTANIKPRMFYIDDIKYPCRLSQLNELLVTMAKTELTRRSLRISELAYSYFDL